MSMELLAISSLTISESSGSASTTVPKSVREVLGEPETLVWLVDEDYRVYVVPAEEVGVK